MTLREKFRQFPGGPINTITKFYYRTDHLDAKGTRGTPTEKVGRYMPDTQGTQGAWGETHDNSDNI